MRILFAVIFSGLILALGICAGIARRAHKQIGRPVMYMLLALIPPIIGNLILLVSTSRALSTVGCYIYFLGMDLAMLALLHFTGAYCFLKWSKRVRGLVLAVLLIDALQLLANPFFGHAFAMEEITAYGAPYFRVVPYWGQTFHRIVDYGILAAVLIVFTVKMIRSPRINSERYSVILATIVFTSLWESVYIFSRTPVDRSMIGFGVFGLLVFFFSLYYRPLRLLDRMLATVASEIPDAIFFFDVNGHCIWANRHGMELTGVKNDDFEAASEKLTAMLGNIDSAAGNWSDQRVTGSGDATKSYVLEHRPISDDRGRCIGSFLSIRDNTSERKTLQREIYNATHDALTQVYNRAGYDLLMSRLDLKTTTMLLLDVDEFKLVNDRNGHEVGDRVLQKLAHAMTCLFRTEDYICRVGGDEFVILMLHTDSSQTEQLSERVRRLNQALRDTADGLPAVTVSVGAAHGDKSTDGAELFNRADHALYDTKHNGRCGITFFEQAPLSFAKA